MKVLDFYNHQGHQYEFFKLEHDFYLIDPSLYLPNWNTLHRPKNSNVKMVSLEDILEERFDVVMYRSGADESLIKTFKGRGAKIIYVSQTTFCPEIRIMPDAIVWNCHTTYRKFYKNFKSKSFYIPHGYDPEEFCPVLDVHKNSRVLSLANMFKKRDSLLGYALWKAVDDKLKICDVFGHHNEDIGSFRIDSFSEQINKFSEYSIYLNTTLHSAMPRSRAEAMMCGMPLVTTKNYGIDLHVNESECFYCDDRNSIIIAINKLLSSDSLMSEYSEKSRSAAIREFSLRQYLDSWEKVFCCLR